MRLFGILSQALRYIYVKYLNLRYTMVKDSIKLLVDSRPTPFYVFDEEGIIENYQKLCAAMRAHYPN